MANKEKLDKAEREQTERLRKELGHGITCVWCGVREAAPGDPRKACTECDDMLCSCC